MKRSLELYRSVHVGAGRGCEGEGVPIPLTAVCLLVQTMWSVIYQIARDLGSV